MFKAHNKDISQLESKTRLAWKRVLHQASHVILKPIHPTLIDFYGLFLLNMKAQSSLPSSKNECPISPYRVTLSG